jgi:hypothetical protein
MRDLGLHTQERLPRVAPGTLVMLAHGTVLLLLLLFLAPCCQRGRELLLKTRCLCALSKLLFLILSLQVRLLLLSPLALALRRCLPLQPSALSKRFSILPLPLSAQIMFILITVKVTQQLASLGGRLLIAKLQRWTLPTPIVNFDTRLLRPPEPDHLERNNCVG